MDGYSTTPPITTDHFQQQLDAACRDRHVRLRIRWSPALTVRRLGNATFKKYPDTNERGLQSFIKGWFIRRNGQTVGYRTAAGVITGEQDGLFVPDIERVQKALAFFVIETRLDDAYAKAMHEKHRYIYPGGQRVDALQDFTEDHAWVWWADISQHADDCCADKQFCRGIYREPDERDLERVRAALYFGAANPRKRDLNAPAKLHEIEAAMREEAYERERDERRQQDELVEALAEDLAFVFKADQLPSVTASIKGDQ